MNGQIFMKSLGIVLVYMFLTTFLLLTLKFETGFLSFKKINWKCSDLFSQTVNQTVIESARRWKRHHNATQSDILLNEEINQSCDRFIEKKKYFLNFRKFDNEESEDKFPIAFSIVTFKDASQVERLLRVIYRPWNYYCIHIDKKSEKQFTEIIEKLVQCLNSRYGNIFATENRVDVQWGEMTVLTADLNCIRDLYDKYKDWKYLINLTGQEFPLKTNAELVKILKAYKGANNIDGMYKHRFDDRIPKAKLPFPLVWMIGSTHITANRKFIEYMFESPKAEIILEALKKGFFVDEQFYNTLNYNPQLRIPGSFVGIPDDFVPKSHSRLYFMTRFKNWGEYNCESGKVVRQICIWGVGDLRKLIRVPHLFTNKLYEDFEPATLKCLEKWYYDKVDDEMRTGIIRINSTFYSSLPFVKHQFIPKDEL